MFGFIDLLLSLSAKMGYWGIFALMTVESSFIPFPSEVVIPPAAYLASKGEMNIYLVVLFGTLGALFGASINYVLAMSLGRKVVYSLANHKLAKYFLIDKSKIKKSEEYFLKYGKSSTFFGRLLPAIRQLISLPAGFSKMNFRDFIFFTFLGSFSWSLVLAFLGYFFGENQDLLKTYYAEIKYFFVILVFVLFFFYFFLKKKRRKTVKL